MKTKEVQVDTKIKELEENQKELIKQLKDNLALEKKCKEIELENQAQKNEILNLEKKLNEYSKASMEESSKYDEL